jgi:hypothetical protein
VGDVVIDHTGADLVVVPEEVLVHVQWAFGGNPTKQPPERIVDPERIVFALKEPRDEGSVRTLRRLGSRCGNRDSVWREAQRRFPSESLRKCHTEHYWAFYSKPELVEKV